MTAIRRVLARSLPFVLMALTLGLAAGCRDGFTPIGKLLDDPSSYDGQEVRVAGEVTRGAGLLGYGAYQVADDTGTLTVVSQGGGSPREGAKVAVEGTFRSVYTIGTHSGAVLVESSRKVR